MTSNSARRGVAFAAALAASLLAAAAMGQAPASSAADLATARELFLQARELRANGDIKGALPKFRAAWATAPTPIIGVELARAHEQVGELLEAREALLAVGRLKVEADETDRSTAARKEAAERAEQLRPKIPTLVVKVPNAPSDLLLSVDGSNVPLIDGTATRKVNPGKHAIALRAPGKERLETVELKEGETKEAEIGMDALSAAPTLESGPATPLPPPPPARESGGSSDALRPALLYGGFGLAAVGLGVGAVTGGLAMGAASDVKKLCQGTVCPESARSKISSGRTLATVSTVGFAAAGAGLAVGLVALLVLPARSDGGTNAAARPVVWADATGGQVGVAGVLR